MRRIRIAPEAAAELDEIWYYVAVESGSEEIANRLVDSLTSRFALIGKHPLIGRRRDDLGIETRSFPVGSYLIFYEPGGPGELVILHVLHGARNIDDLL